MKLCEALETYPSAQEQAFYGDALLWLEGALAAFFLQLDLLRRWRTAHGMQDPVEHYKARIKSAQSMQAKLARQGRAVTRETALTEIYDAAGVRIVCPFVDDIEKAADIIRSMTDVRVVAEKDYIRHPKPNGYRSYHMILQLPLHIAGDRRAVYLEVQLRTIAMDCWACLEHQMKYKHDVPDAALIACELKKCAEDLASDDLSLQTLRELIAGAQDARQKGGVS